MRRSTTPPQVGLVESVWEFSPSASELSQRELEVLQLLARGLTNKEIASSLTLSVRTVEHHRANVSGKLGARSRADLVAHAARRGWLVNTDLLATTGFYQVSRVW